MSRRDPSAALRHMRDHAHEAVELSHGRSRADLDSDRLLNLALVRLVEIVGLRNRLVHGYDTINFDILWVIITTDLPPLIEELDRILAVHNDPSSPL